MHVNLLAAKLKRWINRVSVNATWSAFSLRLFRAGEDHPSFR